MCRDAHIFGQLLTANTFQLRLQCKKPAPKLDLDQEISRFFPKSWDIDYHYNFNIENEKYEFRASMLKVCAERYECGIFSCAIFGSSDVNFREQYGQMAITLQRGVLPKEGFAEPSRGADIAPAYNTHEELSHVEIKLY